MFKRNLDDNGRLIRLAFAVLLLILAIWSWSLLTLLASAFVFFEAFRGWCVVYQLFGKNSCPIDYDERK